jgi:hypothetical protein
MISYLVFTIPWTAGCLALSPPNAKAIKYRKYLAGGFFGTLVPLVYFFIQHKVYRVAGGRLTRVKVIARMLIGSSLHHLRLFRVVVDSVRCGLRRGHGSRLQHVRGGHQGRQGSHQGVRAMAPQIAPGSSVSRGRRGLVHIRRISFNEIPSALSKPYHSVNKSDLSTAVLEKE